MKKYPYETRMKEAMRSPSMMLSIEAGHCPFLDIMWNQHKYHTVCEYEDDGSCTDINICPRLKEAWCREAIKDSVEG